MAIPISSSTSSFQSSTSLERPKTENRNDQDQVANQTQQSNVQVGEEDKLSSAEPVKQSRKTAETDNRTQADTQQVERNARQDDPERKVGSQLDVTV